MPGTEFALGVGEKASLRPMSDKGTWLQVKKKAIAKKINSHSIDEAAPTDNIVLLVINPSSSAYDWTALQGALAAPPGIQLKFYAAPNIAPHLNADVTGVLRAAECFRGLRDEKKLDGIDGFLVCSCASASIFLPHSDSAPDFVQFPTILSRIYYVKTPQNQPLAFLKFR